MDRTSLSLVLELVERAKASTDSLPQGSGGQASTGGQGGLSSALLFGEMKERVVGLYGLQLEWC